MHQAALCLRAPVAVGRHVDAAHRISLVTLAGGVDADRDVMQERMCLVAHIMVSLPWVRGWQRWLRPSPAHGRRSAARWPEWPATAARATRSVLRCVELALDPGPHVPRPLDLRQALVEHELGDAGGRRHFRLQDAGLAR